MTRARLASLHIASAAVAVSLFSAVISGVKADNWPFPSRSPAGANSSLSPAPAPRATRPPFDFPLRQETWNQLPDHQLSPVGEAAHALRPERWLHGETENFIFHFRSLGDALQVAREIEFDLWYVAQSLGASRDTYTRKSHIFVFADEREWQTFLAGTHAPGWTHSFAHEDELFLNIGGTGHGFDSQTLAHETTHAVVARIYGRRRWPVWLNEGFAEYMGEASVAARHWQSPLSNQRSLQAAQMTVAELFATKQYPAEIAVVGRLYDTSAKFVRYLFNKYPKQLFPKFVDRLLDGEAAPAALIAIYGNEFRDMDAFEKRFSQFVR
ncbi:MAG: hypothetical protein H0X40_13750 [Chthoniobacterales bacterium]|nr:hypothetical protein [Chthoniobacterales bacterium]